MLLVTTSIASGSRTYYLLLATEAPALLNSLLARLTVPPTGSPSTWPTWAHRYSLITGRWLSWPCPFWVHPSEDSLPSALSHWVGTVPLVQVNAGELSFVPLKGEPLEMHSLALLSLQICPTCFPSLHLTWEAMHFRVSCQLLSQASHYCLLHLGAQSKRPF